MCDTQTLANALSRNAIVRKRGECGNPRLLKKSSMYFMYGTALLCARKIQEILFRSYF